MPLLGRVDTGNHLRAISAHPLRFAGDGAWHIVRRELRGVPGRLFAERDPALWKKVDLRVGVRVTRPMRALAVEAKRRDTTRQATELCGGKPRHADVRLAWAGVRGPHQPVETDAAAQNRPLLQLGGAALPVIGLATWTVGGDDAGGPPDGQQRVLGSEHQRRRHVVCAPAKLNRHPRLSICGVAAQSARAVQRRVQRAQGLREGAFCRVVAGRCDVHGKENSVRFGDRRHRERIESSHPTHTRCLQL
mmetsp:Transcript_5829/g.19296  ORF Transcript_5829/g.19296 Transcript_5829/m.19296 type:complete len:248 (+) Transcript_5829:803-1546(+)